MTYSPHDILAALQQGDRECGFPDITSQITYPPNGKIIIPGNPEDSNYRRDVPLNAPTSSAYDPNTCDFVDGTKTPADVLFIIRNGTACYGDCATQDAILNYLYDNLASNCWTDYNIDIGCANTYNANAGFTAYLNLPAVQKAVHLPHTVDYSTCNYEAFNDFNRNVEPPAYFILPSFVAKGIKVHIYNGALDFLLPHIGTDLVIQNMTWGGLQGFQKKPSAVFLDANGKRAGTWGKERGVSYHLFSNAGHQVPQDDPAGAFAFVKGFVL